jgi:CubicO group peptidase (beta-lactamase class C family)
MQIGKEKFPLTCVAIEAGINQQLHTCAQVYISQYLEPLASFAIGDFDDNRLCTTETIMPWMSCSKMITALAFGLLQERNLVDWKTPVKDIIPEFSTNGKELITFEHILTHTCGIRTLAVKWEELTWEESIKAICKMPIENDWIIGVSAGYHIGTSWFILGEAVQRLSGKKLDEFIQAEIFKPLGMNHSYMNMPISTYTSKNLEIARFYRSDVKPIRHSVDHYETSKNNCKPGASGRGPISELAAFMEMLLDKGSYQHRRLLSEKTVEAMCSVKRENALDKTFLKKIDWGYGFMIDSKKYQTLYPYSFGPGCSEETFGHNGNQSSAAYVDPEHELVVCFAFNGLPGELPHQKRLNEINEAIYKDLGIL